MKTFALLLSAVLLAGCASAEYVAAKKQWTYGLSSRATACAFLFLFVKELQK